MKKRIFLVALIISIMCLFAISASAANATDANPLGGYDTDPGVDPTTHRVTADVSIDLSSYFTRTSNNNKVITDDTTAKSVLYDSVTGKYYVFNSIYLTQDMTKFEYYVSDLNTAIAAYATEKGIAEYPVFSMTGSWGGRGINEVVHYEMPEGVTKLDGSHCLLKNNKLMTTVWFASSVTSIGTHVFGSNPSLEYIYNFENANLSDGVNFSNIFENSTSLKEVKFPNVQNATFGNLGQVWGNNADGVANTTIAASRTFRIFIPNSTYSLGTSFWSTNGKTGSFEIVYCGQDYEAFLANNSSALGDAVTVKSSEYTLGAFTNKINFVCDYNFCVAYEAGIHTYAEDDHDCTTGFTCEKCLLSEAGKEHTVIIDWTYADGYDKVGKKIITCANEAGCKHEKDGVEKVGTYETPALITAVGYSTRENGKGGVTAGFTVSNDVVSEYFEYIGADVEIGLFIANANSFGDAIFDAEGKMTAKGVKIAISELKYSNLNIAVDGFTVKQAQELELAMALYVKETKDETSSYKYVQSPHNSENYDTVTVGEGDSAVVLEKITFVKVAKATGITLLTLTDGTLTIE